MRPSRSGAIQCASFMAKSPMPAYRSYSTEHANAVIAAAICLSLICLYGACRVMIALGAHCSILPVAFNQSACMDGGPRAALCPAPVHVHTQRRPASRRGRSLHAAHSDAVAASLPRASSSTIVPVAIVCRPGPYRAVAVVNHDNWHAHC